MANAERFGFVPEVSPPYIKFPDHPKEMVLAGVKVYDYISPVIMDRIILDFAKRVDLNRFDMVLVNQVGGDYFAREIARIQNYKNPMIDIEYHRDGRIVTPIPQELKTANIGIVEDIYDGGGTAENMLKDAENATFLFLTQKMGIPKQIPIPNKRVALRIDYVWVGGCGLNLEADGDGLPKDFARDYKGIVVKIL